MKKNLPVTQKERDYSDAVTIISTTDPKGIITYANQDFIEVSGFSEAELRHKNHNVVRHPDMPPAAFQDLWDTLKAGKPWRGIVKNRCKNGDHYWVDAYVTPIYENGVLTGYQSVRSKPARSQVEAADRLYQRIVAGSARLPAGGRREWGVAARLRLGLSLLLLLLAVAVGVAAVGAEPPLRLGLLLLMGLGAAVAFGLERLVSRRLLRPLA